MTAYEEAVQKLYQAPVADFLAERKRLAAELRVRGDDAGATQIAKRPKPITSVWAVNQLYWQARDAFDEMLEAASRLRQGDQRAAKAHRDAIANLRKRAAILLKDAGFTASDATLRRVATTLAAIAAIGGFEPDPPGALAADRDPPGFEAVSIAAQPIKQPRRHDKHTGTAEASPDSASKPGPRERARLQAQLRAAEERERKQREAEHARRKAERSRVQTALRAATSELRTRERALASLEKQLRDADQAVTDAREVVKDLERQLEKVDEAD